MPSISKQSMVCWTFVSGVCSRPLAMVCALLCRQFSRQTARSYKLRCCSSGSLQMVSSLLLFLASMPLAFAICELVEFVMKLRAEEDKAVEEDIDDGPGIWCWSLINPVEKYSINEWD